VAQARGVAALLAHAGIESIATNNIAGTLWAKVFYNGALNALGALLDTHYGALGDDPDLRAVMNGVIDEAFAVAAAEGVQLSWSSAADYQELFYTSLVPSTYVHRSSMLQDLERGRRTEIEAINGAVWRRGQALGIATPYNDILTRLIQARSRGASSSDVT
jgi:2-dehydropantoate 2-reductase